MDERFCLDSFFLFACVMWERYDNPACVYGGKLLNDSLVRVLIRSAFCAREGGAIRTCCWRTSNSKLCRPLIIDFLLLLPLFYSYLLCTPREWQQSFLVRLGCRSNTPCWTSGTLAWYKNMPLKPEWMWTGMAEGHASSLMRTTWHADAPRAPTSINSSGE